VGIEAGDEVGVWEADDDVAAGEHGAEEGSVGWA
jgi:hypothetical protein